jgi:signal transduction histidine kinase
MLGVSHPVSHRDERVEPAARPAFAPRAVRLAAALLGLAAIATYLVIALSRLAYPFPLEYLESNSLVEVQRILSGRPLYAAPAVGYVPDGYPPLYFATSAAAAGALGLSYLPLRLVSLLSSLACFAVLGALVRRETASAAAGIAAAGLLAATYFVTGTWFDVARVDSLFIALSVAALYAARSMRRTRGAVATGLLLAAAVLTKQNGLAEGVAVLTALALGPRRRLAGQATLTYAAVLGSSTLALGLASHGWYAYYVFVLMTEHTLAHAAFGQFWTVHLLRVLGLACCAVVLGARRIPLVLLAGCTALVVESYAALVHSGGGANDLLPAYLALALLAGLATGDHPGGLVSSCADRLAGARVAGWRAGQVRPWAAAAASALVIAQLAVLVNDFHPGRAIPTDADRAVGWRLAAGMRAFGGTIAVPSDPGLALLAGLPAVAHQGAADDVLRASGAAGLARFRSSAARAVAARRFSAIVTQNASPPDGFPRDLTRYYRRCPQTLLPGVPPALFQAVAGPPGRPAYVWLPAGGASCAVTVRTLGGPAPVAPGRQTEPGTAPNTNRVTRPAETPGGHGKVSAQIQVALIAAGCTSAVGLIGTGVIWLLRRAPLRLSVQVSGAVVVLAVAAGTLGTAQAMFISRHDLGVEAMVCVVAAVVAIGFGGLLGRQLEASSLALRQAARSLADRDGGYRSPAGPMTAELAALSRELAVTSDRLKDSRARERALDQSRRELVAWVSHDLRTPLAGLHAMAEALEDGIASDPDRYHRQIRAEVGRLARMVDDLFELCRIEAGTLRLSPGQIALEDLINDTVASTEALARARGVRLTGETGGPLVIQADPRELSRALTNLLVNAIRHTPAEGSVHVMAAPQPGGALLAVADGCGGIPEADLERVFDMAWRGTDPDDGAGLGLAIVRGIVEAHRGQVSVVNTGEGCRFEVRLPTLAV